jgi:hypothetical protein
MSARRVTPASNKEIETMIAKTNTPADIRRDILKLERRIAELIKVSPPNKALRLGRTSDLLTEVRVCELYRMR